MSVETALREAKRIKREREAKDLPVVLMSGNPQVHKLLGRSLGAHEAMIGDEIFEALDGESERQFHHRLCRIAREGRIRSGITGGVIIVSVGDDTPVLECRFNRDGSLITLN